MAIGWFVANYKRRENTLLPERYCIMDDYSADIASFGGAWREFEVLGDRAIVKVRAPEAVLNALAQQPGIRRIPLARLDDGLDTLPAGVRNAIRDELLDAGYTLAEIVARFGNDLSQYTLRDVLRFFAKRRRKPFWNRDEDTIEFGEEIDMSGWRVNGREPIENLDAEVSE